MTLLRRPANKRRKHQNRSSNLCTFVSLYDGISPFGLVVKINSFAVRDRLSNAQFGKGKIILPKMDSEQYLQGQEMVFSRSDIDVVLPALENSTKKKFNNSFSAEQRKFESLEKQIQREREDMCQRLSLEKKDFVRSNLVLKERRELSSRRTARRKEREIKKPEVEEKWSPAEPEEKHSTIDYEDKPQLPRSIYYFPPLYKNVEKDLKEIQNSQMQVDLAKREPVDTESIKTCRYLRLSSAQEREIKTENVVFESDVKRQDSPPEGFNDD